VTWGGRFARLARLVDEAAVHSTGPLMPGEESALRAICTGEKTDGEISPQRLRRWLAGQLDEERL